MKTDQLTQEMQQSGWVKPSGYQNDRYTLITRTCQSCGAKYRACAPTDRLSEHPANGVTIRRYCHDFGSRNPVGCGKETDQLIEHGPRQASPEPDGSMPEGQLL